VAWECSRSRAHSLGAAIWHPTRLTSSARTLLDGEGERFSLRSAGTPQSAESTGFAHALGKAGQSTRRAPNGGDTEKVHPRSRVHPRPDGGDIERAIIFKDLGIDRELTPSVRANYCPGYRPAGLPVPLAPLRRKAPPPSPLRSFLDRARLVPSTRLIHPRARPAPPFVKSKCADDPVSHSS
jgi:hypothetical protein